MSHYWCISLIIVDGSLLMHQFDYCRRCAVRMVFTVALKASSVMRNVASAPRPRLVSHFTGWTKKWWDHGQWSARLQTSLVVTRKLLVRAMTHAVMPPLASDAALCHMCVHFFNLILCCLQNFNFRLLEKQWPLQRLEAVQYYPCG